MRRIIRKIAQVFAALTALWTVWLFITGGFDVRIFGRLVSSHEPFRPLLISALALALFMLSGGDDAVVVRVRAGQRAMANGWRRTRPFRLWLARMGREGRLDDAAAVALTLAVVIVGILDGSKAIGGSDSYGYVSEAELFLHGRMTVEQPWARDVPWPDGISTFSPLAYKPVGAATFSLFGYKPDHDPLTIAPTYSPGLPLLMAAGKLVAGQQAVFWVVPIGGGFLILSTYLIGMRLGSRRLGLAAAFLIATSPTFLTLQMISMTDVPVAAALALACWCILGTTTRSAAGGAIALAITLLIRPNLALVVPVIALWLAVRAYRGANVRGEVSRGAIVIGGAVAGVLCTMVIYWLMYGTPTESGYGVTSGYFAVRHFVPNVRNYTQWFATLQTMIPFAGFAALFFPTRWLWPRLPERSATTMLGLIAISVWMQFFFFLVFIDDSMLRLLLPSYPFIMLGLASIATAVGRLPWRITGVLAAAAVIALGLRGFQIATDRGAFRVWNDEAKIVEVSELTRSMTPDNSVIFAMQNSGNLRYFGGRLTLRWDRVPPDWLDRSVAWMAAHGVRTYALLEDWEQEQMRQRFDGQALAAVLDAPPVFRFGNKLFYDFGVPPSSVPTKVVPVIDLPRRVVSPAREPTIVWTR